MKVAILNNLFPPNSHGGAEEAAKIQANTFFLSRRSSETGAKGDVQGNEVVVLTLSPTNKFGAQSRDGIKIYELRHRNIFNYFNIGKHGAPARFLWHVVDTFNFRLANDIKKILRKEKPDLAVCHNLKGLSYLTPRAMNSLGIKQWQVMHDVQLYTPSGLIEYGKENIFEHMGIFTRIYRFFTRRLFKYAEKVFFPSAWLLNFYRINDFFVGQEKIFQMNENFFDKIPPNPPFSKGGNAHNSSLCKREAGEGFLYVGQLEAHKGILFLLDVFFSLSSRAEPSEVEGSHNSDGETGEISPRAESTPYRDSSGAGLGRNDKFVLHIVGDGSLLPEIKKRAQMNPNIIIHGRISREKLPEFYARAKAVIFPSLVYENAPMVIAESLSCGTPIICSRLGGAPEQVKEGENGATFTPGDANDLAEKIKKFL